MKKLLNRIKQLFCCHEWEKEYIPHAFRVIDGWMVQAFHYKCKKCGKTLVATNNKFIGE